MMLFAISGYAGVGKDTVADCLCEEWNFVKVGLADPIKYICIGAFGFTEEQMFGPSELRDVVDPKWGFAPRKALTSLGTEWARSLHPDIWVKIALDLVRDAHNDGRNVVITDVRFRNEFYALKEAGALCIRLKRSGHEPPTTGHSSELEQTSIPDDEFNVIMYNNSTKEELISAIRSFMCTVVRLDSESIT
jgi:hypothetical protein